MTQREGCHYTRRDDGIYQMIFYDLRQATMDEYFRHLAMIYPEIPAHTRIRLLLDLGPSRGLMPMLRYIVAKSREIDRSIPDRPPALIAVVMEMNIYGRVLDKALRFFVRSQDQMRFFDMAQFDQAIAWLLSINVTTLN